MNSFQQLKNYFKRINKSDLLDRLNESYLASPSTGTRPQTPVRRIHQESPDSLQPNLRRYCELIIPRMDINQLHSV